MKKELKELLAKDNAILDINSLFRLYRWKKDALDHNYDGLVLEMRKPKGGTVEIKSRDTVGIMQEVEAGMKTIMDNYIGELQSKWKGGQINEYI